MTSGLSEPLAQRRARRRRRSSPHLYHRISCCPTRLDAALAQLDAAKRAAVDAAAVVPRTEIQGPVFPAGARDGKTGARETSGEESGPGTADHTLSSIDVDDDKVGQRPTATPSPSSSNGAWGGPSGHSFLDPFPDIKIDPQSTNLHDFELPRRASNKYGLPTPFVVADITFLNAFSGNIRDKLEASPLYQVYY